MESVTTHVMHQADVVIAGAGIIGLSCALELRRHGLSVRVFDPGEPMRAASWAAAGMLAGHDPENPPRLLDLAERSMALYGDYLDRVEALSGFSVPFRTTETLQAMAPDSAPARYGRLITPEEACERVPGLEVAGRQFLAIEEHSLDPRDLCAALPLAAAAAGIVIDCGTAVREVSAGLNGVEVHTDAGLVSADAFVNCCGAWAAHLCPGTTPMVTPRKGQMTMVAARHNALSVVLRSPDVYLVPRGDGRIVIGATVEDAGFDTAVEEPTLRRLIDDAAALWPPAAHLPVLASWAGLRPATSDDLPIIGAGLCTGSGQRTDRCFVASGHFRNGILLAPATAEAVTHLVLGRPGVVDLSPFAPDRFLQGEPCDNLLAAKL